MNNKSMRSVFVSLVSLTILAMIILIPAQAIKDSIKISIKPSSTIVNSTDDAYSATMEPISVPPDGFFFLNVTIPAGYNFIFPEAGEKVVNYTMFNETTGSNQVIINITSNSLEAETVDVTFSTDFGGNYTTIPNQPIKNIVIGASSLNLTKPAPNSPGYINLSLGGTVGPVLAQHKVEVILANGILKNPGNASDYSWYLVAKTAPLATPITSSDVVKIREGKSKKKVVTVFNAIIPANASLPLPAGNLTVDINTSATGINTSDLVITLRNFMADPIPEERTGAESLSRGVIFIGVDASALGGIPFIAGINVSYASVSSLPIPEANLRLYRFNDSSSEWELTLNSGVDTVNKIVYGDVTGFSTFAVMGATPSRPSSGDSGSSTGGGGVTTPEPAENIVIHETKDCNVLSGKPFSCNFSVPEHWVSELIVNGKENEVVTFRIEALKGLSSKVPVPAPGTQYLNIWSGSQRIQYALIRFSVDNSWIVSEGLTSGNLRMYRWDGMKWNELETRVLSTDSSATNYEAKTDEFGYFAITGVENAAPQAATITAAPTSTVLAGTQSATATAPPVAPTSTPFVYIIILIGVIAVVVILYAANRKRNR